MKPLNKTTLKLTPLPGAVSEQLINCGKAHCRCQQGHLHGPYHYRIWREGDKVRKIYVRVADVETVRAQCEEYRRLADKLHVCQKEAEMLANRLHQHSRAFHKLRKCIKRVRLQNGSAVSRRFSTEAAKKSVRTGRSGISVCRIE